MEAPTTGKKSKLLPANAYTRLGPGETYEPIVPAGDTRAEVSPWSISMGLIMVIVWSAACIYMALKAGNAIEASIPIAVLAIFFGKMRVKRSTILENVIVQSIGQAAGVVAAGAAFVIPALYINRLQPVWWHIFLACSIGGFLGIALIIPLRAYFVKTLHGELPFPEATAINELLVSGESAGKGAGRILLSAVGLGAVFDFCCETLRLWNPSISFPTIIAGIGGKLQATGAALKGWLGDRLTSLGGSVHHGGQLMTENRVDLRMEGIAALFGLGYVIGLRYAAIIAAGSVLAYCVLVPLIYLFGSQVGDFSYAGNVYSIKGMAAGQIFANFVKPIGIGAIATAGIIGIIRMGKIIIGSVSLGFKGIGKKDDGVAVPRTALDMKPAHVLLVQLGTILAMAVLFFVVAKANGYPAGRAAVFALLGTVVGFALSFLFTPVAAQAIAIVGTNPVSGMTLITLVVAAAVMASSGLSGDAGKFIALVIGTAVCTALSTSGALITDFKIGYWIGSTPKRQQLWKFVGVLVAALVVAFVIPLMDSSYHFLNPATGLSNTEVLPAPQANMLATIIDTLMSRAPQPILLYLLGALISILLYMAGVPMLAFALGMYLPIAINMTVLAGGFVSWLVGRSGKTPEVKAARAAQGSLIASGLMAGAALIGLVSAILRLKEIHAPIRFLGVGEEFFFKKTPAGNTILDSTRAPWFAGYEGQLLGLLAFVLLALGCYYLARVGARWELAEAAAADKAERAADAKAEEARAKAEAKPAEEKPAEKPAEEKKDEEKK